MMDWLLASLWECLVFFVSHLLWWAVSIWSSAVNVRFLALRANLRLHQYFNFKRQSSLSDLPDELLVEVMRQLKYPDILRLSQTCRRFDRISHTARIWKDIINTRNVLVNTTEDLREAVLDGYRIRGVETAQSATTLELPPGFSVESIAMCGSIVYVASQGCMFKFGPETSDTCCEQILGSRESEERDNDVVTNLICSNKIESDERLALVQHFWGSMSESGEYRVPRVRLVEKGQRTEHFADIATFLMPRYYFSIMSLYEDTFARAFSTSKFDENFDITVYDYVGQRTFSKAVADTIDHMALTSKNKIVVGSSGALEIFEIWPHWTLLHRLPYPENNPILRFSTSLHAGLSLATKEKIYLFRNFEKSDKAIAWAVLPNSHRLRVWALGQDYAMTVRSADVEVWRFDSGKPMYMMCTLDLPPMANGFPALIDTVKWRIAYVDSSETHVVVVGLSK